MNITITRSEGPTEFCGRSHECKTFDQANFWLRSWSVSAPKKGYDKCDFTIANEETGDMVYTGRFDLKHWSVQASSCLREHVVGYLNYHMETETQASDTSALIKLFKEHP